MWLVVSLCMRVFFVGEDIVAAMGRLAIECTTGIQQMCHISHISMRSPISIGHWLTKNTYSCGNSWNFEHTLTLIAYYLKHSAGHLRRRKQKRSLRCAQFRLVLCGLRVRAAPPASLTSPIRVQCQWKRMCRCAEHATQPITRFHSKRLTSCTRISAIVKFPRPEILP